MAKTIDKRPPVAVGHVSLPVKNVLATSAFLQEIGLRKIFVSAAISWLIWGPM